MGVEDGRGHSWVKCELFRLENWFFVVRLVLQGAFCDGEVSFRPW